MFFVYAETTVMYTDAVFTLRPSLIPFDCHYIVGDAQRSYCFAVHELLLALLQTEHPEVVWTACGVLMNLMADPACRTGLQDHGGLLILVDVS